MAYYPNTDIMIYPSSNATDEGRVNSEKNIRSIITRLANKNFIISETGVPSFDDDHTVSLDTFYASIYGYLVVTDSELTFDLSTLPTPSGVYHLILKVITTIDTDLVLGPGEGANYEGLVFDVVDATDYADYLINEPEKILRLATITYANSAWGDFEVDTLRFTTLTSDKISHSSDILSSLMNNFAEKTGDTFTGSVTIKGVSAFPKAVLDTTGILTSIAAAGNYAQVVSGVGSSLTGLYIDKSDLKTSVGSNTSSFFIKNNYDSVDVSLFSFLNDGTVNLGSTNTFKIEADTDKTLNLLSKGKYKISITKDNIVLINNNDTLATITGAANTFSFIANGLTLSGTGQIGTISSGTLNLSGSSGGVIIPQLNITNGDNSAYIKVGASTTYLQFLRDQFNLYQAGTITNKIDTTGFLASLDATVNQNTVRYTKLSPTEININSITGASTPLNFKFNGVTKNAITTDTNGLLSITGSLSVVGNITATKVFNAVFNDYAEYYKRDNIEEVIEPGDIIEINPETGNYRKSTTEGSKLVVGVCSDSYGHILGGDKLDNMEDNNKNYIPVAISGRVFVKIKGNIKIGDLLTSINGKAIKFEKGVHELGSIIGKALSNINDNKVLMQVQLG